MQRVTVGVRVSGVTMFIVVFPRICFTFWQQCGKSIRFSFPQKFKMFYSFIFRKCLLSSHISKGEEAQGRIISCIIIYLGHLTASSSNICTERTLIICAMSSSPPHAI